MSEKKYKFAVIGIGVTGAWVAREITRYTDSVCMLEKGNDVASGSTKANSAIVHGGYDAVPGTLKAKLNIRGNELIRELADIMAIPFRQIGSLVVASGADEDKNVINLYNRGIANGISADDIEIWDGAKACSEEPNLNSDTTSALFCRTAGVVSPFELCAAAADVAVANGADFYRAFDVCKVENGKIFAKDGRSVSFEYAINCAGVYADYIAGLFGDSSFTIKARKGEYSILDKNCGDIVSRVVFRSPSAYGKGILVSPTVDGNIIVGPTAIDIPDKDDNANTSEGLAEAFKGAKRSVPSVTEKSSITVFAGVRAIGNTGDFIIGFSDADEHLLNVAGIESPGLTSAPATGEYVVSLLLRKGLINNELRSEFNTERKIRLFREMTDEEKEEAVAENSLYGRIICRCETVTEGDIVNAIRRPVGAVDLDGIKRRVRAGMGRCQGGFCSPRVLDILSRELDKDKTEITKCGGTSYIIRKQEQL